MTIIKSHLILATMLAALVAMTVAMSAAQAGPKGGGGIFSGVSGLDLGSGR